MSSPPKQQATPSDDNPGLDIEAEPLVRRPGNDLWKIAYLAPTSDDLNNNNNNNNNNNDCWNDCWKPCWKDTKKLWKWLTGERVIVAGLWLCPFVSFDVFEPAGLIALPFLSGMLLVMLRCSRGSHNADHLPGCYCYSINPSQQQQQQQQPPLPATDLFPILISSWPCIAFDDSWIDFRAGIFATCSFLILFLLGTETTLYSCCCSPSCCLWKVRSWARQRVLRLDNDDEWTNPLTNSRKKAAVLTKGLWVWSAIASGMTYACYGGSDYILHVMYFPLIWIGHGVLLFLLWCTKEQEPPPLGDRSNHRPIEIQQHMLASEVIPTMIAALVPSFYYAHWSEPAGMVFIFSFMSAATYYVYILYYLFRYGIPKNILLRLKNFDPLCLKKLEEEHYEKLKSAEEDEERRLEAQIAKLAHLEDRARARRNQRHERVASRQKFLFVASAVVMVVWLLGTPPVERYRDYFMEFRRIDKEAEVVWRCGPNGSVACHIA